jgi:hypothetical protein
MPILTKAEINELIRLRTTADEGVLGDEKLWAAKGTISLSVGYWGREGVAGFGLKFGDFLRYSGP